MDVTEETRFQTDTNVSARDDRTGALLTGAVLFILTAIVFWSACENSFVGWDDWAYVYLEPKVLGGITFEGIIWSFNSVVVSNWHPITMLSLQFDAQFFGKEALGFHRTAVLLHALNATMLFWTLLALSNERWRSTLVAALFALHPLRVESVAWISERKDLVSGFFFLLTILSYVRYAKRPTIGRYSFVAIFLALGLASKSMLVTVPCVLLLLDYWPLRRLQSFTQFEFPQMGRLILEKIPLFAMSVAFSIITMRSQQAALKSWPFQDRIANAILSYIIYLRQTVVPIGLSTFYGRREIPMFEIVIATAFLVAITVMAVWQRNRRPYLLVGWFWYLGTLVPVIGLVQVGKQVHADRYTYLPQIGLLLVFVWFGFELAGKIRWKAIMLSVIACVFLGGFVQFTRQQIPVWRDTESLWTHANRLDSDDKFPVRNLMLLNFAQGNKEKAVRLAQDMIRTSNFLEFSDISPMIDAASYLSDSGEHEASFEIYDKLFEVFPDQPQVVVNRGKAKAAHGDWQAAAEDYRRAVQLAPKSDAYPFYLAHALEMVGEHEESRQIMKDAVQRSPNWPVNAATSAFQLSMNPKNPSLFWPICLAEQANLATDGTEPAILDVLAVTYANALRFDEAVATVKKAVEIAKRKGQKELTTTLLKRLELYEKKQPFRQ